MTRAIGIARLETGVPQLDLLMRGGLPKGSVTVVSGAPGCGKTILCEQIAFHLATAGNRVLYFNTLSEPTAKTLRYLKQFGFFDARKLHDAVQFVDLGVILRSKGLEQAGALVMQHLKRVKPSLVVIDSFKVFDDLAKSREDMRKFGYELAVNLMAWETTGLLLGEYAPSDVELNPLFSIVDGLVTLTRRESAGEQQRFFQIAKMRGTDHSRDEHPFTITNAGIEIFAPKQTMRRDSRAERGASRCKTGMPNLDALLGDGIPWGSSLLISGVAGTGKTVLSLEFIYRGALAGEKGVIFSFEETDERLRAAARGLGWDLDRQIDRGMVEIVFIPQPEIRVESHLVLIANRIESFRAKRVAIDSVSVFLHKIRDPQAAREKVFHLATIVQKASAVAFLATDIPYGSQQLSRFGVEETVVDGVILLTLSETGLERERYLEIYKLRNTAHLEGRHRMIISKGGVSVHPRYVEEIGPGRPASAGKRPSSGRRRPARGKR